MHLSAGGFQSLGAIRLDAVGMPLKPTTEAHRQPGESLFGAEFGRVDWTLPLQSNLPIIPVAGSGRPNRFRAHCRLLRTNRHVKATPYLF